MNAQDAVDQWNEKYPVGTRVSVQMDVGGREAMVTRSKAKLLGDTPVIWLVGRAGGFFLERCLPTKEEHIWYDCSKKHDYQEQCQYCDGELKYCIVCNGGEGELTTDCCGHKLNKHLLNATYLGGLDYKDGRWVVGEIQE